MVLVVQTVCLWVLTKDFKLRYLVLDDTDRQAAGTVKTKHWVVLDAS